MRACIKPSPNAVHAVTAQKTRLRLKCIHYMHMMEKPAIQQTELKLIPFITLPSPIKNPYMKMSGLLTKRPGTKPLSPGRNAPDAARQNNKDTEAEKQTDQNREAISGLLFYCRNQKLHLFKYNLKLPVAGVSALRISHTCNVRENRHIRETCVP